LIEMEGRLAKKSQARRGMPHHADELLSQLQVACITMLSSWSMQDLACDRRPHRKVWKRSITRRIKRVRFTHGPGFHIRSSMTRVRGYFSLAFGTLVMIGLVRRGKVGIMGTTGSWRRSSTLIIRRRNTMHRLRRFNKEGIGTLTTLRRC